MTEQEIFAKAMALITEKGKINVTLTQIQTREEKTIGSQKIAERVLKEGIPSVAFAGKYAFIDVDFKHAKGMDANAVEHILKMWAEKSTEAETSNKEIKNHFYFEILIMAVDEEDGYTYGLQFVNPAFWYAEESTLRMSYEKETVSYFRQEIDYSDIAKQKQREMIAEMEAKNGLM